MLPSLEKAIIPFLRVRILSVKFYTIFMLCIFKAISVTKYHFFYHLFVRKRATLSVTLLGPPRHAQRLTLLGGLKIHENLLM